MTYEKEEYKVNNVVKKKTELYLLASKLKDMASALDKLSEGEKRVVIERIDQKDKSSIRGLYVTILGGNKI
ncbi:hypothetical protein [Maledivibacter halophilus]|uniref:Uncharacterized protein n=1 Tax=Maledivibacter halophilus TaxID=36842 RepID=A0A1T5MR56_9FIRM|nr:hypothetical protein [Maledivibacter halophilus]SKC90399.1 hypothetical protein SAMN02194393_05153 [Maledivibacter halophilus]